MNVQLSSRKAEQAWFPRSVARCSAALCVAYFVFWACSPPSALPPVMGPVDGISNELGFAARGIWGLSPVYEDVSPTAAPAESTPVVARASAQAASGTQLVGGGDAGLWYRYRFNDRLSLAATIFGGSSRGFGGGLIFQATLLQAERLSLGAEVSAGAFWVGLGLPISYQLNDSVQLYTNPVFQAGTQGNLILPVGISWKVGKALRLGLQTGTELLLFPNPMAVFTADSFPLPFATGIVSGHF